MNNISGNPDISADILIAGAGPTGLMLACQLAIHHVSFRIIDKNSSPSKCSGALIIQARTLEIFEQMGIAAKTIESGIIASRINILPKKGKMPGIYIKELGGSLSRFPFFLLLEQSRTEQFLLDLLQEKGYSVERQTSLKRFQQENNLVNSIVKLPDGNDQVIHSRFIIAADGPNSIIRKLLNIPFEGKSYSIPLFTIDTEAKSDFLPDEIYFSFSQPNVAGFFPLSGSRWRIDSIIPGALQNVKPISIELIEKNNPPWQDLNFKPVNYQLFSVFFSQQKYANSIRFQNCFLVGDSAHVHTPVGAQGMNTGIQDAFNLAWKIAFVIKQKASRVLLDSYSDERQGISRGFARSADFVFQLITSKNVFLKFFRMHILNSLLKLLFHLAIKRRQFLEKFFESISQININYPNSILTYHQVRIGFQNNSPKPGDRIPFIRFTLKNRLTNSHEILAACSFTLIILASDSTPEIEKIASKYEIPSLVISKTPETMKLFSGLNIVKAGYYLIRPDHHIALISFSLDSIRLINYLQLFLYEK